MTRSVLSEAFEHHTWATVKVLDACASLTPEQLQTNVPGTYGSIIDTLRHLVGGDSWYLSLMNDAVPAIDEEVEKTLDVPAMRALMEAHHPHWIRLLGERDDPDEVVVRHRDDGSESHAPLAIRLAQVVHHGTDHRSQVCTALTTLGIEPPEIDLWEYGREKGSVIEVPAATPG